MKRILALVLAAMMLLSMAACAASTPAAAEAAADTNTEAVTGVEDSRPARRIVQNIQKIRKYFLLSNEKSALQMRADTL